MIPIADIFKFVIDCIAVMFDGFKNIFSGAYIVLGILLVLVSLFTIVYKGRGDDNNRQ